MSLRRPSKNQPENFDFNPVSLEAAKSIIAIIDLAASNETGLKSKFSG